MKRKTLQRMLLIKSIASLLFHNSQRTLVFLSPNREPDPGDMNTFFKIASLRGRRALKPGTMNIAQVIHL
jgi:hypothetical protein